MNENEEEKKALETFIVNNQDLEHLEKLSNQFNFFEALDAVHSEKRHSNFLAFLLDPAQNHGLGDTFVKRFLKKVVYSTTVADLPFNVIDLDVWNLENVNVQREW